jgi:site-specific DNA-methyltransferase (adenine-specific)
MQSIKKIQEYKVTNISINDLVFDESNPNKLTEQQEEALKKTMEKFGYLVPIIINERNEIGDGEHRAKLYRDMGITEIPAYVVPQINDDIQRRLLRQTMNKLHGEHEIKLDSSELLLIFQNNKLNELSELIAQPREGLENILTKHQGIQFQHEDNFDVDKALEDLVPETQLGDIWQLGNHRIICADCTDNKSIDKLLKDKAISQLNTDPPYGVLYGDKNKYLNEKYGGERIEEVYDNDEIDTDYREMFNSIFSNINNSFTDYNTIYIWLGYKILNQVWNACIDSDINVSQLLTWVKNNVVVGRSDYYPKAEHCIYGWKGKHKFYSPYGGQRSTILEYDKPSNSDNHPTMKPIEMISQTIKDGTQEGDIVMDCFLGSGTTLISCEQTNRILYGVEIDPHYVEVAVKRWEAYTGKRAERNPEVIKT